MYIIVTIFIMINIFIYYQKKFSVKFRFYPFYIQEEDNLSIIENKKINFRSSLPNYSSDEDYYLCFMHDKENIKILLKLKEKIIIIRKKIQ